MLRVITDERASVIQQVRKRGEGVEIGVHEGAFSERLLEVAQPKKLTLIDPWAYDGTRSGALYGGKGMSQEMMDARHGRVLKRFAPQIARGRIEVLRMESQAALARFADGSLDFAYIDGDHSYAAVKADLEGWLVKLRPGGLLIADDYRNASWWGDGVIRACHGLLAEGGAEIEMKLGSQIAFRKLAEPDLASQ
ncbi:class I SAM-dependent methyltransferase (plasmid) [Leisingera sp. S132]|uniref:class I SAM-dependent methyltransferase n=1 Tax=Leisingera sp. S132 TaxID=2867016 RepID=UPI0021A30F17|nr:class I SAM-dependent methyltransferase [Leisingera sp. S132]UWQ81928.1 class I SAM-dependent methyltransferase [Leisingera sp. S132]